ncbi:MAG: molybdopterin-dependent oxidoreductase [Anaerolineales bacterium]|nr:molybdopterin-dependent oxidoreductase [Anaerolineales bacterium]
MKTDHDHADSLQPHSHEPNPAPPSEDPTFQFVSVNGRRRPITVMDLQRLAEVSISDCYIVSTGHGTSGPFTFTGATLLAVVEAFCHAPWSEVEVVSADGFGNRIYASELHKPDPAGPILLAYAMDDQPLSRAQGLVRLIVPSERDDALRQVKWVGEVRVVGKRP